MIRLLTQPSSYEANPRGYAINQIGHAALGAGWAYFGLPVWLWVAGYLTWEAVQVLRYRASLWDCIEDASFALGGALALMTGWPAAAVLGGFLAAGIARRIEERAADDD